MLGGDVCVDPFADVKRFRDGWVGGGAGGGGAGGGGAGGVGAGGEGRHQPTWVDGTNVPAGFIAQVYMAERKWHVLICMYE